MKKSTLILLLIGILASIGLFYWFFRTEIRDHFYSKHVVYWNENVVIKYSDFKDDIDYNSDYNLWYFHGMYLKTTNIKDAKVYAIFDQNKSWIKDTSTFDYKNEMELQRLRFDLYEVYARKFNKEIDKIKNRQGVYLSDLENIGDKLYIDLNRAEDKIFDYNLTNREKIQKWRPKVDSMLIVN
jgi:hypothetical protein